MLGIIGSASAALAGAFFLGRASAAEKEPKPQILSTASVYAKHLKKADEPFASAPLMAGRNASAALLQVEKEIKPRADENAEEWQYVLRGGGTALFGSDRRAVKAGDLIYIPRGESHGFINGARAGTLFLSVTAPPSDGEARR
jgi:mannose-6-phosphate isomerase-like protein (cupin superfamily)